MEGDSLQSYIDSCRQLGFSDQAIRQQLISAGWSNDLVEAAFEAPAPGNGVTSHKASSPADLLAGLFEENVSPKTPHKKPAHPKKVRHIGSHSHYKVIAAVLVIAVLAGLGGGVALAENGYMPAVSRVYRKTDLPLLWKGTNSRASVSIGRAILSAYAESELKLVTESQVRVDRADGAQQVSVNEIPALADVVAWRQAQLASQTESEQYDPSTLNPLSKEFADVPDDSVRFPFEVRVTSETRTDASKNSLMRVSLALPELVEAVPMLSTWINPKKDAAEVELRSFPSEKRLLYQTSLLPVIKPEDVGKWFNQTLSDQVGVQLSDNAAAKEYLESEKGKQLVRFVDAVSKDKGVIRHKGEASAWYQIHLNPSIVSSMVSQPEYSEWRSQLESLRAIDGNFDILVNVYVNARTVKLSDIEFVATFDQLSTGYNFRIQNKSAFSYGNEASVKLPTADLVYSVSPQDYWKSLAGKRASDFADTGILNAQYLDTILQSPVFQTASEPDLTLEDL